MSTLLDLKNWDRFTHGQITMELRRLKRAEARPLQKAVLAALDGLGMAQKREDLTPVQRAQLMVAVFESIPEEQIKEWFEKSVRNVGGLAVDGNSVTTGLDLLDVADDNLILAVLMQLNDRSRLSVDEAKTSASRSTSSVEAGASSSASPAPSTEREAGIEISTVMATKTVN